VVGWVLQVAVIASGILVPALLGLGVIFLGVWVAALHYGAKADRLAARNRALAGTTAAGDPTAGATEAGDPAASDPAGPDAGDPAGPDAG
jgi:hypothetical protein